MQIISTRSKNVLPLLILCSVFCLVMSCSGLNYCQRSPEADSFHPKHVVILPLIAGDFEAGRQDATTVILNTLNLAMLYPVVSLPDFNAASQEEATALTNEISHYVSKLTNVGFSDPQLTTHLGETMMADGLLVCRITAWGYGKQDGDRIAKVGMWMKLVDPQKGTVIWTAGHEIIETYWMIKPSLSKMFEKLASVMIKEMPH